MLTVRQRDLLVFIKSHMDSHGGVAPTFTEMASALRLKSKAGIHRILSGLEERGFIVRRHNQARALTIIRLPGTTDALVAVTSAAQDLAETAGTAMAAQVLTDLARDMLAKHEMGGRLAQWESKIVGSV